MGQDMLKQKKVVDVNDLLNPTCRNVLRGWISTAFSQTAEVKLLLRCFDALDKQERMLKNVIESSNQDANLLDEITQLLETRNAENSETE